MPRPRLPPRLTLRSEGGRSFWVIRDQQNYTRTGIPKAERERAETALRDYLAGTLKPWMNGGEQPGMIYYISVAGSDSYPIKIGYTVGTVSARIAGMQTGNPNTLVCLGTEHGSPRTEADRHKEFRYYHIRAEWFSRGPLLMRHIQALHGNMMIYEAEPA